MSHLDLNHMVVGAMMAVVVTMAMTTVGCQTVSVAPQPTSLEAEAARRDLEFIRDALMENHPGAVYPKDEEFNAWLSEGFTQARNLIAPVTNANGHHAVLQFYVAGFADTHTSLTFKNEASPRSYAWPGFFLQRRGTKTRVAVSIQDDGGGGEADSAPDVPPRGAELIDCEGETAERLIETRILPYSQGPRIESSFIRHTPDLLIDNGNPFIRWPHSCRFRTEKDLRLYPLTWKPIRREYALAASSWYGFGPRPRLEAREFRRRMHWISIPTFQPDGDDRKSFAALHEQIPSMRNDKLIVFDVRGNRGGDPEWGDRLLELLFGREYLETLEARSTRSQVGYRRASKGNLDDYLAALPEVEQNFGRESSTYRALTRFAKDIELAIQNGVRLVEYRRPETGPDSAGALANRDARSPVQAKLVLLTDAACASACLMFADTLLATGTALHVGGMTSADSIYMEGRKIPLPSGIGELNLPKLMTLHRTRGHNIPLVPRVKWPAPIADQVTLENWVMTAVTHASPLRLPAVVRPPRSSHAPNAP